MTNILKGHEDYIVSHTRKEIMQKFNVNYSCVNYYCIKNGLKPIAEGGRYRFTDEMKDFLKEHTIKETAYKFLTKNTYASVLIKHKRSIRVTTNSCLTSTLPKS